MGVDAHNNIVPWFILSAAGLYFAYGAAIVGACSGLWKGIFPALRGVVVAAANHIIDRRGGGCRHRIGSPIFDSF
jgi:hypothetical protein